MADDEKELFKAGVEAALRPFSNLIERLFGGSAVEIGGMWQDSLRVRRFGRQLKLYAKVQRMISEAGFEPHQIPDNVAMPALSYASMEDVDYLQEKWAALLANASRPTGVDWVTPAFPDILHQLAPNEAKFLDSIFDRLVSLFELGYGGGPENFDAGTVRQIDLGSSDMLGLYAKAGLTRMPWPEIETIGKIGSSDEAAKDRAEYQVALQNLLRHRLIEPRDQLSVMDKDIGFPQKLRVENDQHVYMTALGFNFVKACRRPEPRQAET